MRRRGRPLAYALIGLVLIGGAVASAQTASRDRTTAELKKQTALEKKKAERKKPARVTREVKKPVRGEARPKTPVRTSPASAAQPAAETSPAPGTRFEQSQPVAPPRTYQADAPPLPQGSPSPAQEPPAAPMPAVVQAPAAPAARPRIPPPVSAVPVPSTLNMIRTAPEQIGQVPSQFMWIRDGLMAARDSLDGTLVFFDDDGHVLGRAKFPSGFDTEDIIGQPTAIRLIDFSHRTQITIQRNVDPAATTVLQSTPNGSDSEIRRRRLQRRSAQELIVNDERQNGTHPLTVRALAGGQLAQAYEISPGTSDNRFVVSEEITAVKPALTVRVFVQRFDREGRLNGVVYVPLDNFELVPRNIVAVTGAGRARVLRPTDEGVRIDEYDFVAPPRAGNRRLNDSELRSLSRKLREIPVDTTVQGDTSTPFNDGSDHVEVVVPPSPPIARAKVLENARAYLTVNWVMQRENFERPGIENRCAPGSSYIWLRPRHFTREMIGTTIGPMPYRWGGDDTPQTFRTRSEWGALAGDMCTCRQAEYNYCVFADSAGVDCSGFVSRVWGIEKRGTSGLLDVAADIDNLEALKPGDAFDWPQRHIRLFTGYAEGAATAFTVLEASTRYQCEGVCERIYRPSELNGYKLIRYKGISEAAIATNGGAQPSGAPPPAAPETTTSAPSAQPEAAPAATAEKRVRRSATVNSKRTRQR